MFHYGHKPITDIKKDIRNINILQKNISSFPEPISQIRIKIDVNTFYNDCFEIALLRFIHIIFGKNEKIDMNKLQYLMGNGFVNNELYNFLLEYNTYKNKTEHYNSFDKLKQRIEWCKFLNNREIFKYKYSNKYKLCSSLENIFAFFKYFFNFRNVSQNDNKTLNNLMIFLSDNDNRFSSKIYKNGFIGKNKIFEEMILKIYINGNNLYNWQMYQYSENINNTVGKEITGYSELKYSVYLDKFYVNSSDSSSIDSDKSEVLPVLILT
jgi:hypothetical protein